MIILRLAMNRRSVRRYLSTPIPKEDIKYVLEVARHAPSGGNRQPWRFILVYSDGLKREIRKYCEEAEKRFYERAPKDFIDWARSRGITWVKSFLTEAPILILVFGKTDEPYWIGSVWLAIGYLILAAEEKGYATLTYTPSNVKWANKLFKVPEEYVLAAIIPIGVAGEKPSNPGRLELSEIVYLEEWGEKFN